MTLVEALTYTKNLLEISPEETQYDRELQDLLQASAGTNDQGDVVWRYYISIAFLISVHQDLLPRQGLISASDSKFVDPSKVIEWWLLRQKKMDCRLTYDPCWSANLILKELTGKQTKRFSGLGSWELAIANG